MNHVRGGLGLIVLATLLAGCGDGTVTPDKLPAEQKAPEYGQKTGDMMKNEIGVPGKGGVLQK